MSLPRRAVATAAVLLGMLGGAGWTPALAGLQGQALGTHTATSGIFAVVPTTLATAPPPGALTLTYAAILSPGAQYFDAVNTGTTALAGASYSVAVSGGGLVSPSITLAACTAGSWNQTTGVCSGTPVTLGTWTSASSLASPSTARPAAAGSRLGIKASLSAAGALTAIATATVSVSVTSGSASGQVASTTSNG